MAGAWEAHGGGMGPRLECAVPCIAHVPVSTNAIPHVMVHLVKDGRW